MAVIATDIKTRYSGGASNALPGASLGGVMSSVGVVTNTNENLFDNVLAAEATSGDNEYRCLYVFNSNPSDTLTDVTIWVNGATPAQGSTVEIGVDPAGVGNGTATGVAAVVPDEQTAPAGVTFSASADQASALPLGTLGPLTGAAFWVKRVITPGAVGYVGDGFTLGVKGTPA